jgi:hypothetical protein
LRSNRSHDSHHRLDHQQKADQIDFVVLPCRWVVERFFDWINHYRRPAKDFKTSLKSAHVLPLTVALYQGRFRQKSRIVPHNHTPITPEHRIGILILVFREEPFMLISPIFFPIGRIDGKHRPQGHT